MQQQAGSGRITRPPKLKKDNAERWLLTYSDMITLLLAFFVIMYGISSADAKKFTRFSEAMKRAFNVGVLEGSPSASVLEQTVGISTEAGDSEDLSAASSTLETVFGEMGSILEDELLADKVSIGLRQEGVAISVSGNLLFASGRADLRPDSLRVLQAVARALARLPNQVRIEGHTDDIPPSGTEYPSNWELSGARAVAVVRYLTEIEGIDPSRLSAAAYAQFQPVSANDSPRSRAKNRRSEILILNTTAASSLGPIPTPIAVGPEDSPEEVDSSAIASR
ncbi:MAG: OmpA family protein [Sphingomonadaceae bacterium]